MTLPEALAAKPADLEVTLGGIELASGGATITLLSAPWAGAQSGRLRISVEKLLEISLFERGSEVRSASLKLSAEHPLLLDYGPRASIFGQAPLPDPYRFFLEFQKLVRDQLGIPREPLRYLNWQARMTPWLAMVYSRSFNLLTGPKPLAEAAGDLLAAQSAEYIILEEKPLEGGEGAEVFSLGEFWVIGQKFSVLP